MNAKDDKKATAAYTVVYRFDQRMVGLLHPSYLTVMEQQTRQTVEEMLAKHRFDPGNYLVKVRSLAVSLRDGSGLYALTLSPFHLSVSPADDDMRPNGLLGDLSYNFEADHLVPLRDSRGRVYYAVDLTRDITDCSPKFILIHNGLLPSPVEAREQGERMARNFLKSFEKFRFPCEIACDYPDVIFEVRYAAAPDEALRQATFAAMDKWVAQYNRRKERNGEDGIHYVGLLDDGVEDARPDAVYIHVDFGDCSPLLLKNAVTALHKSDLPIKGVVLR